MTKPTSAPITIRGVFFDFRPLEIRKTASAANRRKNTVYTMLRFRLLYQFKEVIILCQSLLESTKDRQQNFEKQPKQPAQFCSFIFLHFSRIIWYLMGEGNNILYTYLKNSITGWWGILPHNRKNNSLFQKGLITL